jgi:flagellar motor switch protein FliM
VRETTTEERLATMLGAQLVGAVAARIDALLAGSAADTQEFRAPIACPPPIAKAWTIRAAISESTLGIQGALWFTLDDAWMARLLRHLAAPRDKAKEAAGNDGSEPLVQRLQLTLTARLLQKELPLGTLMDLQIGEVIPVSLGPTEVLVDAARLFRAVVAERAGKLCLTSFEDVE